MISFSLTNLLNSLTWKVQHEQASYNRGKVMPEHMRKRGKLGNYYAACSHKGVRLDDCLGTTDRRWAERELADLKSQVERGEYQNRKKKFEDLIPKYQEMLQFKSESLQERNNGILKKHVIPFFGSTLICEINKETVIEYKLYRERANAVKSTLQKELCVIEDVMLQVFPDWKNPTIKYSPLMKFNDPGKVVEYFLEEEDMLSIHKLVPEKYRQIYLIAAYSGLRLGNVVNLKWENINNTTGFIEVIQTKTFNKVRVPISKKLHNVLKSVPRFIPESNLFSGINSKAVSTAVKRSMKKAGYPWASFHSLRHFCASFLTNNDKPAELVGAILGHKDSRSTSIYTHHSDQRKKEAMSVFDKPSKEEIKTA
jgi:integrase